METVKKSSIPGKQVLNGAILGGLKTLHAYGRGFFEKRQLAKLMAELEPQARDWHATREQIIREYGEETPDGGCSIQRHKLTEESRARYDREWKELMEQPLEISLGLPLKVRLREKDLNRLAIDEHAAIEGLVEIEEDTSGPDVDLEKDLETARAEAKEWKSKHEALTKQLLEAVKSK